MQIQGQSQLRSSSASCWTIDHFRKPSEAIVKHEEDLKRKFDVSYFVAKEEIPTAKYKAIIELKERHGVNFHRSYKNDTACGEMIDCIGSALTKEMKDEIGKLDFLVCYLMEVANQYPKKRQYLLCILTQDQRIVIL